MTDYIQVYDGTGTQEKPSTVADAVDRLVHLISEEGNWAEFVADMKLEVAKVPDQRQAHIPLHHGLGRWIRNNFGLWSGNPALLTDCTKHAGPHLREWMKENNSPEVHPDDASSVILDALIAKAIA